MAASGIALARPRRTGAATRFRPRSPGQALRRKEWVLLLRDPWLMSQSLMQLLYLLPPFFPLVAQLLWRRTQRRAGWCRC